jgi:hypothetical protein
MGLLPNSHECPAAVCTVLVHMFILYGVCAPDMYQYLPLTYVLLIRTVHLHRCLRTYNKKTPIVGSKSPKKEDE